MVYSAKSDDINTISQFTRRKDITVTTGGTSTPTNYQVKVTISYESEMQADFDDIRFNTKAGVYIDYWIESKTDSVTADVWIELTDAITDPGSDTIWMYYGNIGIGNGGDGDDTFITWRGTESSTYIEAAGVAADTTLIYETRIRQTSGAGHSIRFGVGNGAWIGVDDALRLMSHQSTDLIYNDTMNEGAFSRESRASSFTTNQWYRGKIVRTAEPRSLGYIDNVVVGAGLTTNLPAGEVMGLALDIDTGTCEQDWSFVRKYIANEPTPSYGTPQHQRRVPQFIG